MSFPQLKHALLSIWHGHNMAHDDDDSGPETFGSKVRQAFRDGKFDKQIKKAEIDYAEGRALDKLY